MYIRFRIYLERHRARIISRYSGRAVSAYIGSVPIGTYLHGERIA